jgi:Tfp pilus assembly protein PilN
MRFGNMIDINLLPPELRPKKLISPGNLIVIGIFSLIALSLIFSSLRLLTIIQGYSERVQSYDDQIKGYRQQVEDIRELSMKVKLLKARLIMVQGLLQEKSVWSDKLNDLYQCLPENGIWLDQLTLEQQKTEVNSQPPAQESEKQNSNAQQPGQQLVEKVSKTPMMLKIIGTSTSVDRLSEFIANLEGSWSFRNVVFGSTIKGTEAKSNKEVLMSFNFTVQVMEVDL